MKPEYKIRSATIEDSKEIAKVVVKAIPGYPFESAYSPTQIEKDIINSNGHRIVAVTTEEEIVATAVLSSDYHPEIKRVAVRPDYQKNGLASAMATHLSQVAAEKGIKPWADVRADQIGMQRAALKAGLQPIWPELGKHRVYSHPPTETDLGPARETMIHMTSIILPEKQLLEELIKWPDVPLTNLISNLESCLNPLPKNSEIASKLMPSPSIVRQNITERIDNYLDPVKRKTFDDDIEILQTGNINYVVVKPDASGFILNICQNDISDLLALSEKLGLQVVTYYSDVSNAEERDMLHQAGMQPSSIRTWQESSDKTPTYQIAWRKTFNDFDLCLHSVNIDIAILNILSNRLRLIQSYA